MSGTIDTTDSPPTEEDSRDATISELRAQIDLLQEENERLRNQYARARRSSYRRVALSLSLVGLVAFGGAAVLPPVRNVFIILGGIGVFSGILTWYLTPEQFVAADTGTRVYNALSSNEAEIVAELGLSDARIYLPAENAASTATLYIPQMADITVPRDWSPSDVFLIGSEDVSQGIAVTPTGADLYREFARTADTVTQTPLDRRVAQVSEAIVEVFELARGTDIAVDADDGRATLTVTEPVFGGADDFDDPVSSLFAVGVAETIEAPVRVTDKSHSSDSDSQYTVTVRWDPDTVTSDRQADAQGESLEATE